MEKPLGRLVKHLKEKCAECQDATLQHRERNVDNRIEEYKYCPNCKNEIKFPYKDKGRKHGDSRHKARTE